MTQAETPPIVDTRLPFLATVCSPTAMRPVFNDRVLPLAHPGQVADRVTVERVDYTPGERCVVLYSIQTGRVDQPLPLWALATFEAEAQPRGRHPGTVALPDYFGTVEFFPADARLPSLCAVMSPDEIWPLLASAGLATSAPTLAVLPGGTIDVLRYTPRKRCVLRFTLDDPAAGMPPLLIGKVYRSPRRAAAAWRAHTALCAEAVSTTIRFPEPLAFVEKHCLVLMEQVAGECMRDRLLAAAGPAADDLVVAAASALAEMHRRELPLEHERSVSVEMEIVAVQKQADRLLSVAPRLAPRVTDLLGKISRVATTFPSVPQRRLHGDYTPSQLIPHDGAITIVDFDRVGVGDPAVDVGTFMAKLVRDAVLSDHEHLRGLPRIFLDAYTAGREDGLAERSFVMQSLVLARIALSCLRRDPAGCSVVFTGAFDSLLEAASACLASR